ncbi:MAG: hypothetical protein ACRCZS_22240 [Chroococcidiopsis sp.]
MAITHSAIALPLGHLLCCFSDAFPGVARFGYPKRLVSRREDSHPQTKDLSACTCPHVAAAAEIYLNGELTVGFPEDVKIPVEPNQMVTAEVLGSSLKLNDGGLERAITSLSFANALLKEQSAVRTLEIKAVQPQPF